MNMKEELAALVEQAEQYKGRDELNENEAKAAIELADKINELREKIAAADAAHEKMNAVFAAKADEAKPVNELKGATIGERFVKSDAMREVRARFPFGIGEKQNELVKGLTVHVAEKAESSVISRPVANFDNIRFEPGIINPLEYGRRLSILDLITHGTTDATSLKYRQLVAVENNAAVVPESLDIEGDEYLKPISTIELASATAVDTTYADGAYVTTQEWNDDGALRAILDSTLARNIELVTENLILNGTGENEEPLGILKADIDEQEFDTDIIRTVRKARAKLDALGYRASALVVSPNDASEIDLLNNSGRYYGGGPVAAGATPSLWGVPIVVSSKVEDGTAIMGDWSTIHLLIVDPLNINVFDQHMDFAQRNLLYLRAEYRALQLLRAPAAFVKVTLGN